MMTKRPNSAKWPTGPIGRAHPKTARYLPSGALSSGLRVDMARGREIPVSQRRTGTSSGGHPRRLKSAGSIINNTLVVAHASITRRRAGIECNASFLAKPLARLNK